MQDAHAHHRRDRHPLVVLQLEDHPLDRPSRRVLGLDVGDLHLDDQRRPHEAIERPRARRIGVGTLDRVRRQLLVELLPQVQVAHVPAATHDLELAVLLHHRQEHGADRALLVTPLGETDHRRVQREDRLELEGPSDLLGANDQPLALPALDPFGVELADAVGALHRDGLDRLHPLAAVEDAPHRLESRLVLGHRPRVVRVAAREQVERMEADSLRLGVRPSADRALQVPMTRPRALADREELTGEHELPFGSRERDVPCFVQKGDVPAQHLAVRRHARDPLPLLLTRVEHEEPELAVDLRRDQQPTTGQHVDLVGSDGPVATRDGPLVAGDQLRQVVVTDAARRSEEPVAASSRRREIVERAHWASSSGSGGRLSSMFERCSSSW